MINKTPKKANSFFIRVFAVITNVKAKKIYIDYNIVLYLDNSP
jgi:hypothetical protein